MGAGLLVLGVPPSGEEVARALLFLLAAIAYGGVWLAVAMLCSVIFRSPATAALVALGLWLFMTILWPMLTPVLVQGLLGSGVNLAPDQLAQQYNDWAGNLALLSPTQLFSDAGISLLSPSTRSLGAVFVSQLQGALLGAPLPLSESMALSWPQFSGLIAAVIVLFTLAYISFQRQEIRA
jgi:ABC-2 type transport system permease protein